MNRLAECNAQSRIVLRAENVWKSYDEARLRF